MGTHTRLIAALVPFAVTAAGPPPLEPAFDPHDATAAVQHALDSAPPGGTVHLRNHGAPWAVRPLWIRRDDLTVTFATGVVLLAKRGEFHAPVLSLLAVAGARNVTLRGLPSGAGRGDMPTLRMWKQDYANESLYSKAEWRHGLWIGRRKASPHAPPPLSPPTPPTSAKCIHTPRRGLRRAAAAPLARTAEHNARPRAAEWRACASRRPAAMVRAARLTSRLLRAF